MTSASASSLSTIQFMYLYRATGFMAWISFKIYFKLNSEVLQGNAAVLSVPNLLKGLIIS